MKFIRPELNDGVAALRRGDGPWTPDRCRAVGDNCCYERNVSPDRQAHFESFSMAGGGLVAEADEYFDESVQGLARDHAPSTFEPMNDAALMPAGIERNQLIVRVERIDGVLNTLGHDTPDEMRKAVGKIADALWGRTPAVLEPLLRVMNAYPGARPAFGCFRSEVASDVGDNGNWLPRLRARLGLGHFDLKPGDIGCFALMTYTVGEVFDQARVARPFAKPTVLESQASPFFFPAPPSSAEGFAADLEPAPDRKSVREFLHVRITYDIRHLAKVTVLDGPTADPDIDHIRGSHFARLRAHWPDTPTAC